MKSLFESLQHKIVTESFCPLDVHQMPIGKPVQVEPYVFPTLKAMQSSLDPEKISKVSIFTMNSLVREALNMDAVEQKRAQPMIEKEVKKRLLEVTQQAYAEGFASGSEEAKRQIKEETVLKAEGMLKKFQDLVMAFENAASQIFVLHENLLLELMMKVCSKVLHQQVTGNHDFLFRLLKDMLSKIDLKEYVKVGLSPQDEPAISYLHESLLKEFCHLKNITFFLKPELAAGSVVVENDFSALCSCLDENLEKIQQTLLSAFTYEPF